MYATNFLQGRTTYSPSVILELWFCSPDGRVPVEISHDVPMYSLEHVYTSIKPARAALSAFAVQIFPISEARKAVLPANGLHATSKKWGSQKIEWSDVGKATVARVEAVIRKFRPLTWDLLLKIAGGGGTRDRRPAEAVSFSIADDVILPT